MSHCLWGIVSTLAGAFNSFRSSLAGINGLFLVVRIKHFNINSEKIRFLPRDSTFGSYLKAFLVILLEQFSNFLISEYDFTSDDNFSYLKAFIMILLEKFSNFLISLRMTQCYAILTKILYYCIQNASTIIISCLFNCNLFSLIRFFK